MRPTRWRDGGQATAELALVLPLVGLLALLVVQVAVTARAQVLVVHAAREGARGAAVSTDVVAGARASAARAGGLDPARLTVSARRAGELVVVEVGYDDPTDVALVGALLPDVHLRGTATMRSETP